MRNFNSLIRKSLSFFLVFLVVIPPLQAVEMYNSTEIADLTDNFPMEPVWETISKKIRVEESSGVTDSNGKAEDIRREIFADYLTYLNSVGVHDANGSKTYGFRFYVKSHEFSGGLSHVWFYDDAISLFISSIEDLTSGKANEAILRAMSDFVLTISPSDNLGHFAAKFNMADALTENTAQLTVRVETHLLDALASELNSILASSGLEK